MATVAVVVVVVRREAMVETAVVEAAVGTATAEGVRKVAARCESILL